MSERERESTFSPPKKLKKLFVSVSVTVSVSVSVSVCVPVRVQLLSSDAKQKDVCLCLCGFCNLKQYKDDILTALHLPTA